MSTKTHYEALRLRRTAATAEIKAAYLKILQDNRPDKMQGQDPFVQNEADKRIRAAHAAWNVLCNPISRFLYDKSLSAENPFNEWSSSPGSSFADSSPSPGPKPSWQPSKSKAGAAEQPEESDDEDSEKDAKEAEYRTMTTPTSTIMDIKISEWRLTALISSKFRFTNDVSELSDPNDGSRVISFAVGLERDTNSPESWEPTVKELTIKVQEMPGDFYIKKVQTIFKQMSRSALTLVITITADASPHAFMSWKFGFDFDLNSQIQTRRRLHGTCMIFSVDKPPTFVRYGHGLDTPENVLKWDKQLKANAWCDLGNDRVAKVTYGGIEMWRFCAVGYRKGSHFGM
ncbi:hypothetical protein CC86DRAFT_462169 [Ophiobolus disseminans]|uniref:J domain-containing protein n=1 Tax=Ophiobolus disseminans TaxID=1469910 RepID=A0A6A7ANH0_9PLEO|nr:hypothetical protein CC86DRAFT_462169 [Ophiobolus disseminans]